MKKRKAETELQPPRAKQPTVWTSHRCHPPVTANQLVNCRVGLCIHCDFINDVKMKHDLLFPPQPQPMPTDEEDEAVSIREDNAAFDIICDLEAVQNSLRREVEHLKQQLKEANAESAALRQRHRVSTKRESHGDESGPDPSASSSSETLETKMKHGASSPAPQESPPLAAPALPELRNPRGHANQITANSSPRAHSHDSRFTSDPSLPSTPTPETFASRLARNKKIPLAYAVQYTFTATDPSLSNNYIGGVYNDLSEANAAAREMFERESDGSRLDLRNGGINDRFDGSWFGVGHAQRYETKDGEMQYAFDQKGGRGVVSVEAI